MNKFFILTRGRTGSTAIIDELSKVRAVSSAAHELFLDMDFSKLLETHPNALRKYGSMIPFKLWKSCAPWWRKLAVRFLPERMLINQYLGTVEAAAERAGKAAVGFKVLSSQLDEISLLKGILHKRGYCAIYLKRSISHQVISGLIAKQRGLYNTDKKYQDDKRYVIDINEFRQLVEWEAKSVAGDIELLKAAGFEFIEVNYEEFMADRQAFFGRVLGFLGVPAELPPASAYSVMIKDLKHTVENYQEVADCAAEMGMRIE